jgi:hypothetical protein
MPASNETIAANYPLARNFLSAGSHTHSLGEPRPKSALEARGYFGTFLKEDIVGSYYNKLNIKSNTMGQILILN